MANFEVFFQTINFTTHPEFLKSGTYAKVHIFCSSSPYQVCRYGIPKKKLIGSHSSEKRGLRLMKCSSETLQNLPCFMYIKTQSCFFRFSFLASYLTLDFLYIDYRYIKHGKQELFIKHKPLFSEECSVTPPIGFYVMKYTFTCTHNRYLK